MRNNSKKLHLGCGLSTPEEWLNVDASWNARLAKHPILRRILKNFRIIPSHLIAIPWSRNIFIHNVRQPLPFDDASFLTVYASHLLEHLYLNEARKLLKECWRVLEPGGILRMMVPDLKSSALDYVGRNSQGETKNSKESTLPANVFIKTLNFRDQEPPRGNIFYRTYTASKDFHTHKWMYDTESLTYYFKEANFVDIKEMPVGYSRIEDIEKVEFNKGLCVEGVKPQNQH